MPAKSVGSGGLAARSIWPMPDCRDSAAPSASSESRPLATRMRPSRWSCPIAAASASASARGASAPALTKQLAEQRPCGAASPTGAAVAD